MKKMWTFLGMIVLAALIVFVIACDMGNQPKDPTTADLNGTWTEDNGRFHLSLIITDSTFELSDDSCSVTFENTSFTKSSTNRFVEALEADLLAGQEALAELEADIGDNEPTTEQANELENLQGDIEETIEIIAIFSGTFEFLFDEGEVTAVSGWLTDNLEEGDSPVGLSEAMDLEEIYDDGYPVWINASKYKLLIWGDGIWVLSK